MASLPPCPKFLRGHCPKSDVILLSEDDAGGMYYSFGCKTCRTGFALSKPTGKAAAQLERALEGARQHRQVERLKDSRKRYFT
jgi:hypothetical protein